jgi:poly-beta-1,6-N-acetyl-D-glucosamine synthase
LSYLIYIISFCLFTYNIGLLFLLKGWLKIPVFKSNFKNPSVKVSVVIVVRNEEKNISKLLQSIDSQTYKKNIFEVIIVDDNSNDQTIEIINKYLEQSRLPCKIILLGEVNQLGRKKIAITKAVKEAMGTLILLTDGDCFMGPNWIENYVNYYQSTNCKFISGPVTFLTSTFFERLQIVEFASLIGTGAASIQLGQPNMCNGANLAFEKEAFEAVNGYQGFENQPSGDDEFLMYKINEKFKGKIGFLKSVEAITITNAQQSLNAFYNQRKRWASKWDQHKNFKTTLLAIFIFLVNFASILIPIFFILGLPINILLILLGLRLAIEWVLMGDILSFLGHSKLRILIPLVQLIYPIYIFTVAIGTLSKSYTWKGRKY